MKAEFSTKNIFLGSVQTLVTTQKGLLQYYYERGNCSGLNAAETSREIHSARRDSKHFLLSRWRLSKTLLDFCSIKETLLKCSICTLSPSMAIFIGVTFGTFISSMQSRMLFSSLCCFNLWCIVTLLLYAIECHVETVSVKHFVKLVIRLRLCEYSLLSTYYNIQMTSKPRGEA